MNKNIGLYFGTFNPIHVGHLIIANHMAEYSQLDEIWLVVTPHNPLKKKQNLLDNYQRLDMVHIATQDFPALRPSNVEFKLPQPNYTVNTLAHLEEKYPEKQFSLILGEDNLKNFHKWKNYEVILERHALFVYPRLFESEAAYSLKKHPKVHHIDAPRIEISSSFIRKALKAGKNVRPLLPYEVWKYLDEMNFYK